MTVGKAIFYLLDNSTDLTAIVGTRIYPEVAQQDAPLPYVVYNISNNEPSDEIGHSQHRGKLLFNQLHGSH